ncbi:MULTISPECIES: 3-hydroxyacyl-CoA dehydrogenase/enoyl-CoA hydratase family protein [unclassified Luteococcus]|uniref:3-hydroxyacyl-CoA dehydrogenase/enoyl-CoA hydratase family protein n=1 Tax=unclassified Luteococcus TaxID=2639923 RepID=UPI00313CB9E5
MTSHQLVPAIDAPIRTAAVLGAGSMGAGIAAHLANAGVEVLLFDIPAPDTKPGDPAEQRSARAQAGIDAQVKRRGFMQPGFAARVTPVNTDDDLARLGEAEWIVEAVFEDPQVKADTYAKIAQHRQSGSIVSSNTSTIPLAQLTKGMEPDLRKHFAITHFFNPPRVMRLVEVVSSPDTDPAVIERLNLVLEQQLGKVALPCRDTPGFIANRIGNFWMESAACLALDAGLPMELADAVFSKPFGIPRTGVFGLFDYIGLQLVRPVWGSLHQALPQSDAFHRFDIINNPLVTGLVERGLTGRTGASGFYRGRDEVVTDGFEYRAKQLPDDPALAAKDARGVMSTDSPAGRWAWDTFRETLDYCCVTAPEVADTVDYVDQAMVLGYGWQRGPFALADAVGLDWIVDQYRATGHEVPALLSAAVAAGGFYPSAGQVLSASGDVVQPAPRAGVVTVAGLTAEAPVWAENDAAVVHQVGNGIGLFSMKTPMNSLQPGVLDLFDQVLAQADAWGLRALVVASDNERAFCAGADLATLAGLGAAGDRAAIEAFIRRGAELFGRLRSAPFPVVSAVRGVALGGGAELVLHSDLAVVHSEAQLGMPERTVGLLPGWGGSVQTVRVMQEAGVEDPVRSAFAVIADAKPVAGAFELEARGMLHTDDLIALSPDHVLGVALEAAERLADGYTTSAEATIRRLPAGSELEPTWQGKDMSENDARILRALEKLYVATGPDDQEQGESELSLLETACTLEAYTHPDSVARAEHMAKTRKPLKN